MNDTLKSFNEYCEVNPSEPFWQALKNWSGADFVYLGNLSKRGEFGALTAQVDGQKVFLQDTYELKGRP